jgi:prevent-host-death family protein
MMVMNVGVRELRDNLSRHLAAVRGGAEVTVTDHGKPVARLVPYETGSGIERYVTPIVAREIDARAAERGLRVEQVVTELLEAGLGRPERRESGMRNGIPVMAGVPGHVVTDELVAAYRDDV